jgi:purine-nucleoside phosphorylase
MTDPHEFPLLWDTTDAPSAFDPADWFAYCEAITGRSRPLLPSLAIQTVMPALFAHALERFDVAADDFTLAGHPFAVLPYRGREIVIGYSAKGSYAAGGLDELIALGARRAVFIGGSATLVHEIAVDDVFVPTKALRDEGVSLHYQSPSRYAEPCPHLTASLVEAARARGLTCHSGPMWTTTAHFRQAIPRLRAFRAEGCLLVNNEASPAFAVGHHRGAQVAALLMVGDTVADDRFIVPTGHAELYREDDSGPLLDVALEALCALEEAR